MRFSFSKLLSISICLSLLMISMGTQPVLAAGTCFVNDNASGSNNGTSWANAYTSLQSAIADSCTEIWVAAGTYKPHASLQSVSFALETGTAIYGGFAGTETLRTQRNPTTNLTILSGDLSGNDSGFTNNGENSFQVVTAFNVTNTAVLDGFTITGGNANGITDTRNGGGIYIHVSIPTLTNLIISGNNATNYGGGIYNDNSNPTITNITINGNQAGMWGGGMYTANSSPTLSNVTFSGNSARSGGGMYNGGSSLTLSNVTFSGNSATAGEGGGMFNINGGSSSLSNVTFSGNSASISGGGMSNFNSSSPTLKNVIIANSTSGGDCVNNSTSLNAASKNNLIEDGSNACGLTNGVNGNIIGSDPNLGSLTGSPAYFPLKTGSPAINAGDNTTCAAAPVNNLDQRGLTRPINTTCDIGAVEANLQSGTAIIVNTALDTNDGACEAYSAGASDCSLRDAINYANSTTGVTITFASNYTITLASALPVITSPMTIYDADAGVVVQASTCDPVNLPGGCSPANYRVLSNSGSGLTLNGLTIRYGVCSDNLICLTGAGVYNTGTLTINNSSILNNKSSWSANPDTGAGAGVYSAGNITISNSTIANNWAGDTGGGVQVANSANSTIVNSTLANNISSYGAGLYVSSTGTSTVYNVTVANNNSDVAGAGVYVELNKTLTLYNSLITGNLTTNNCGGSGTLTANSNNIASDASCGSATQATTVQINLQALANNGGPTQTMALGTGSVAMNAGDNTVCAASPVNNQSQNGVTRPSGSVCDVGSYEKSSAPTSATFGDVPMNHPYWLDIEILYANGFTGGCSASPLLFCPDTTMDRAQGAVFMLRGLVGTSYVPPVEPFANPFGDSWAPGPWAQRWAQGMLDQGLTAGCSTSPLLYCPWEQMPRAQAAVFGMRLLNGSAYLPPAGTGTVFADVNGSEWYAGWAEQAYANGLLPACGTSGGRPLFCPNSLVSRGLGAYMIVKARNLSMP